MKLFRMLFVTLVAALGVIAAGGAGSATAADWCELGQPQERPPCGFNERLRIAAFEAKLAAGTEVALEAGFMTVKCKESGLSGETEKEGKGTAKSLTFSACSSGCTFEALHVPYHMQGTAIGETGNGTVAFTSGGSGSPGGKVNCSGVECFYESEKLSGELIGGEDAKIVIKQKLKKTKGSAFCAAEATFSATYLFTNPSSLTLH
jgi:hypothetical protein